MGCSPDSWGFGATDPSSGATMLLGLRMKTLGRVNDEGYRSKGSIPNWSLVQAHVVLLFQLNG